MKLHLNVLCDIYVILSFDWNKISLLILKLLPLGYFPMLFGERLLMLGPELALIGQTRVCPRKSISLFNILKDLIGIAAFPQIRILILKFHDRKINSTYTYMKELIKVHEIWQIIVFKHSPINQHLGIDGQ